MKKDFQFSISCLYCLAVNIKGIKKRAAIPVRNAIRGNGPNSGVAMRKKRNDAPHSAPNITSSIKYLIFKSVVLVMNYIMSLD